MNCTITDILTSLEVAISTEITAANDRAVHAEEALETMRDGLLRLVGTIKSEANFEGRETKATGKIAAIEATSNEPVKKATSKTRSRRPSNSVLLAMLDADWKTAKDIRDKLRKSGSRPAEGSVYNWYRRLARENISRVEAASQPERWRLLPPTGQQKLKESISVEQCSFQARASVRMSRAVAATVQGARKFVPQTKLSGSRPDIEAKFKGPQFELHHGDCLEVMRKMPSASVDLVFTSPPYNLAFSSGGGLKYAGTRSMWPKAALAEGYGDYDDARDPDEYVEWQKSVLQECWRLIPENGAIFYNHKPRVQNGILQTPLDLNPELPVRQIIIWNRKSGINFNRSFFLPSHEWIVVMAKPKFRLRKGGCNAKDVWTIQPERHNSHPAPFPVELPRRAIENTDAKIIFDPFAGSGSTGVAALENGRKFIGIDRNEEYLSSAYDRMTGLMLADAA
ncbi:site-specific DNA-methyltransferase [Qipengyuania sp. 1NDH17]|uniref:Methyltransferase n=1 Tax=Qipengyuania polymorpha TaxID=2867234 RepID=A0ABS7J0K6_9SPHN|nr:site-specific DNA-methyltransferase [Qipengyuania polymorpha]MBX7459365.1 site-specific DNA-methyltransferase [Qipengyuania polymorpha]